MEIKRTILGVPYTFVLSEQEMFDVYCEIQHKYDREDCLDAIDCMTDEEVKEEYGITREEFTILLNNMAYEKRRNMDKYGMDWECARDEAVHDVIHAYKESSKSDCGSK